MTEKVLVLSLPFLLLVSGCVADGQDHNESVPRIGDTLVYTSPELKGAGFRFVVYEESSHDLKWREPCGSVTLLVESLSASSADEVRMCLDETFERLSVRVEPHPVTNETVWTIQPGGHLAANIVICVFVCPELGQKFLRFDTRMPPDYFAETLLYKSNESRDSYVWETTVESKTGTRTARTVMQFADQPYPESIQITEEIPPRDAGEGATVIQWSWERAEASRGEGKALRLQDVPSPPVEAIDDAVPWNDVPIEGESPFLYSFTTALQRLGLVLDYVLYRNEHPGAYLAAAQYAVYLHTENAQTEYLWGLVFQDGRAGFEVKCHLLVSTLVSSLPPYSEETCFHARHVALPERTRENLPARALSLQTAAALWHQALGSETVPLADFHWTTFDDFLENGALLGSPQPREDITIAFSYMDGNFNTNPDSPTWIVTPPTGQARALPVAYSIFDGETGRMWRLASPQRLSLD